MKQMNEQATQTLFNKGLVSQEQFDQIKSYRNLNIFSINAELKIFLYLSVLLFTSGIGILIYQNIDTIGHSIIISLIVIVTVICYYFDNKNVLSLAITGLAAYIGLTVSPQSLLQNEVYNTDSLSYAAIGLGIVLIAWNYYSSKINLKTHFALIFLTFALHLIGIACVNNIIDTNYFLLFSIILGFATYYFYTSSYKIKSVSLFVFTLLYGFIGLNITLFKIVESLNLTDFFEFILVLSPFYSVGAIILFIMMIKKFNSEIKK